jgi:hypothetical protein
MVASAALSWLRIKPGGNEAMDWEIIRSIPKWAMENIIQHAVVSGIILIAGFLLWLRGFQKMGIELWEARRRKRGAEREERLSDLAIRMDALKETLREDFKVTNLVLNAQAYIEGLTKDNPADIREILRRRAKMDSSSNLPLRWASRY